MRTVGRELYRIGEVSKRSGVSPQTIRFYEKKGLFSPASREGSRYRLYDEEIFRKLAFIGIAKDLGFTVGEIRDMLKVRVKSLEGFEEAKAITEAKLKEIEERIAALDAVKKTLGRLLECFNRGYVTEKCPVVKALEDKAPEEVREMFRKVEREGLFKKK